MPRTVRHWAVAIMIGVVVGTSVLLLVCDRGGHSEAPLGVSITPVHLATIKNETTLLTPRSDTPSKLQLLVTLPGTITSLHRYRVDQGIGSRNRSAEVLGGCSVTSQVKVWGQNHSDGWVLETFDERGKRKNVGGDEYYVMYKTDNVLTAVALVTDRRDGTYQLDFVQPPLTTGSHVLNRTATITGTLTMHFQFSCGIGRIEPPAKADWKTAGYVFATASSSLTTIPQIRPATPLPNFGLTHFDRVVAFGDSLMEQLVSTYTHGEMEHKEFFADNLDWHENVAQTISTRSYRSLLEKLHEWHGHDLTNQTASTALLLGSGVWEVLRLFQKGEDAADPDFADHISSLPLFIGEIEQRYPDVDLFWKSPTALHVHRLRPVQHNPPVQKMAKYMSSSRSARLHNLQKQVMAVLDIPFLDLYEWTYLSASWSLFGDARHYQDEVHRVAYNRFAA